MYPQKNYTEILSLSSSHGLRLQEISKSSQNTMTGRENNCAVTESSFF